MPDDNIVWKGSPAQIVNWKWNFLAVLLLVAGVVGFFFLPENFTGLPLYITCGIYLLIPLLLWFVPWLRTKCYIFELTNERIRIKRGVLNREIDETELYRVRDTTVREPFFLRLFGLGTIIMETSDRSDPTLTIMAIRDPNGLRSKIRDKVEKMREAKGVRDVDFTPGGAAGDVLGGEA